MFNNKYGDEGLTILFKEEISKASIELDFLGNLKEVSAFIKLGINYINPFTYYFINDALSDILKVLNNIELDYSLNVNNNYLVSSVVSIEKRIDDLKDKLKDYKPKDLINNKVGSLMEVIYTKCLKLERSYYKLNQEYRFQSYLNRLNDYFYLLKDYLNKEL